MEGSCRWVDEVEDMARVPRECCDRVVVVVGCAECAILMAGDDMVLIEVVVVDVMMLSLF
jgi:hypothetical protein